MPPKKSKVARRTDAPAAPSASQPLSDAKLSLPAFLQIFQKSGGMSVTDAMAVAKKTYPTHNTPAQLAELTPVRLIELKVDDQEQRKYILAAVKKAGYVKPVQAKVKAKAKETRDADEVAARTPNSRRWVFIGGACTKKRQNNAMSPGMIAWFRLVSFWRN